MTCSDESPQNVSLVTLPETVDDEAVSAMRDRLRRGASVGHAELRIDASGVKDISVRGLAMLVGLQQLGAASGTCVVIHPSPRFAELIQRMDLTRRIPLAESCARLGSQPC